MTDVTLPDGTVIRASSIVDRREHDPTRSFGLYMDHQWRPSWPAEMIDWPDFGLPVDPDKAAGGMCCSEDRCGRAQTTTQVTPVEPVLPRRWDKTLHDCDVIEPGGREFRNEGGYVRDVGDIAGITCFGLLPQES